MAALSGVGGSLAAVAGMANWSISYKGDPQSYASSGTGGATGRIAGNGDWSGSYRAYGHTPYKMPGESLPFSGSMDGTNGVQGTAIVDSVEISVDIEGAKPIEHTVNFSGNSALSRTAVGSGSTAANMALPSIGCGASLGTVVGSPVYTAVAEVRNWKLSITSANQSYASSETAGLLKRVGGPLDATMSWAVYGDDLADLPAAGSIHAIKLSVSATLFWEIWWGIIGEASDIQVDREGGGLIGATINASLNFVTPIAAADTLGKIALPGPTIWWPTPE